MHLNDGMVVNSGATSGSGASKAAGERRSRLVSAARKRSGVEKEGRAPSSPVRIE
jgi:hypothetical protein